MIFRCALCGTRITEADKGRCNKHKRTYHRKRKLGSKQYGHKWQVLREKVINRYPVCLNCFANGVIKAAEEVDHLYALNDESTLEEVLNVEQLAPLCRKCHVNKTRTCDNNPKKLARFILKIEAAKEEFI